MPPRQLAYIVMARTNSGTNPMPIAIQIAPTIFPWRPRSTVLFESCSPDSVNPLIPPRTKRIAKTIRAS